MDSPEAGLPNTSIQKQSSQERLLNRIQHIIAKTGDTVAATFPKKNIIDSPVDQSKRNFLKASVASATALALSFVLPQTAESASFDFKSLEQEISLDVAREILRSKHMEGYIPVYESYRKLFDIYGSGNPYSMLTLHLDVIAKGGEQIIPAEALEIYKSDWGSKKESAVASAVDKVSRLNITEVREEQGETVEDARNLLTNMAKFCPSMILVIPDHTPIEFIQNGGEMDLNNLQFTTSKNEQNAAVTLLHEGEHIMDSQWATVADYLDKTRFLNYVKTYIESIDSVLTHMATESEDFMYTGKEGRPILMLYLPAEEDKKEEKYLQINKWEDMLIPAPEERTFPENVKWGNKAEEYEFRYNRVARHLCKRLHAIEQKVQNNESLTSDEEAIRKPKFQEPLFQLKKDIVSEIGHYFVGPVQKLGGGLPTTAESLPQGFYHDTNRKLQEARFKGLSPDGKVPTLAQIAEAFVVRDSLPTNNN